MSASDRRAGAHSTFCSHFTDPDLPPDAPWSRGVAAAGPPGFTVTMHIGRPIAYTCIDLFSL